MSLKHFLNHGRHIPYLLVIQLAFIIIFGCVVEYDSVADSKAAFNVSDKNEGNNIQHYYPSKFSIEISFLMSH